MISAPVVCAMALASLAPFTAVDASGDVRVVITRASDAKVDAPAGVSASVKDGVLVVTAPASAAKAPVVTVTLTALTALTARGPARLEAKDLDAKVLDVSAADAARITLAGKSASLRITGTGTARIDAGALSVQNASVQLANAARATVNASASLDVDLRGASQCTARQKPKRVDQKVAGAAKLVLP